MYRSLLSVTVTTLLILAITGAGTAFGQALSLEDLRQARHQLAHRQRRIMMNNDGCDALYFPADEKATAEGFLAKRTTPLAGTHVDAIAFCPTSSGFSSSRHKPPAWSAVTWW